MQSCFLPTLYGSTLRDSICVKPLNGLLAVIAGLVRLRLIKVLLLKPKQS